MINCPIAPEMRCEVCRHNTDEKCWWFFPAKLLTEILTIEERLEMKPLPQEIIHRHIHYNSDVPMKQWGRIDAISNELKYLRQKYADKKNEPF